MLVEAMLPLLLLWGGRRGGRWGRALLWLPGVWWPPPLPGGDRVPAATAASAAATAAGRMEPMGGVVEREGPS